MNKRIKEFLRAENKSSAQMAEEIGVQPSGISHILSGRNNPSLDFVLKMLEKYQFLSTEWLLFGKGSMYKDPNMQMLFDGQSRENGENSTIELKMGSERSELDSGNSQNDEIERNITVPAKKSTSKVEKIVWFYENNIFEEYFPA